MTSPVDERRPVLYGDAVELRPIVEEDIAPLLDIAATPDVARWWPNLPEPELRTRLVDTDEAAVFAVWHDARVIGLIQYYEETDPEFRHAGIDVFLDPSKHGAGLGTDAVRTLTGFLLCVRDHHRLVIDPAVANEHAIRCYARVGFRPVGTMREYQVLPTGQRLDGLLMDLLRSDVPHLACHRHADGYRVDASRRS